MGKVNWTDFAWCLQNQWNNLIQIKSLENPDGNMFDVILWYWKVFDPLKSAPPMSKKISSKSTWTMSNTNIKIGWYTML